MGVRPRSERPVRRSAAEFFPPGCGPSSAKECGLDAIRGAAGGCRGCDLYLRATRTVFGAGSAHARVMLVGEQPGDEEDVEGLPFVGPAGRELDEALERAGIERQDVWLTNAVKHFKFEQRGSRRMHVKPTMLEVRACRPWLDAEIEIVEPDAIVLLGATAAKSMLGSAFSVTRRRGEPVPLSEDRVAIATWHPSAVLRAPEREDRHRMRDEIAADLQRALRSAR